MNQHDQPNLALGLGCDRNTPATTITQAITEALAQINASLTDVQAVHGLPVSSRALGMLQLVVRELPTDGSIVGFEALLRWQRPEVGLVPPDRFIPLAEESELIVPIGEWVLAQACSLARQWEVNDQPLRVAVNVSAMQFRRRNFVERVGHILGQSGVTPALIELEMTESAVMEDSTRTTEHLQALKAMGVRLAIDDFGTGYSSLAYLKLFPINRLKLDRTFVQDVDHDPNDAAICAAAIGLGHNLGLDVVAEGVETASQYENLARMGCDLIQGYYFSKPLPVCEAKALFLASDGMLRPAEEMVAT